MLILVHSPKGGVGSTVICAHLAMQMSRYGHHVTAIDCTFQDTLKLYFGLLPNQMLVEMTSPLGDAMVVSGVDLMNGYALSHGTPFIDQLKSGDSALFDDSRITIVDVASGDRALRDALMAHADLNLCVLLPRADSLAMLPVIEPGTPTVALDKTAFVLNQLDDRKRLSRHAHSFLRTLLGDAVIGGIRYDEALNESVAMFQPLTKFAPLSVFLPDIAELAIAVEARLGIVPPDRANADARGLAG